jgi:fumarylacetoacetate (FAA) hydrolase family protein
MQSHVPAVKTALKDRLKATLGTTAEVYYGSGDPGKMGSRAVLIGPVKNRKTDFTCGMTQANESFDIEVMTSVVGPLQDSFEALVKVAYDINDAIVTDILAWDYSAAANTIVPADSSDDEAVGDGFREAVVKQTLHVMARI